MSYPTKIATCCYCGTRAALVLKGKERHELACSACGAPLHDLKMLPKAHEAATPVKPSKLRGVGAIPVQAWERKPAKKAKKKKKRKSFTKRFFDEAFDVIEDIFD